jgi:hypothetical protein
MRQFPFFKTIAVAGLFAVLASSCHLAQRSAPSVIIVAVDNLGVNQINCAQDSHGPNLDSSPGSSRSGIALMCQESVRFTHAFTTSPLVAPALASLLTAQYPIHHGLRDNTSFLSGKVTSVAEVAQKLGVATSFFSGGAPVLRKLNLQQGFETFDDYFTPTSNFLFRPFRKTGKIFESWLKDIGSQSFFSVFYLPDLNFINSPTFNSLGEGRELTYESQLEEFDDSFYSLIETLKKYKVWDSTVVILVGLNGPRSPREGELAPANLLSERTQISLLVKQAQKPRDEGLNWGFDQNVNLADVGASLFELYGAPVPISNSTLPVYSLQNVLKNPSKNVEWDRPLLIESAWSEMDSIRSAFRWGQFLYLLDEKPIAYNSLIDKLENSPLRTTEPTLHNQWEKVFQAARQLNISMNPKFSHETFLKWKGLSDFWSMELMSARKNEGHHFGLERLAHRLKMDPEVSQSYSVQLLDQQNWTELQRWSQGMLFADLEKIAAYNLDPKAPVEFEDECLHAAYMGQFSMNETRPCADTLTLSLFDWVRAEKSGSESSKEINKKKFLRQYFLSKLDHRILENFWTTQGVWDLSSDLRTRIPTVELVLSLPDFQKYRQAAVKFFQQQKDEID